MSEELLKELQEMRHSLLTLHRSPSQFKILLHLISTGRSLRAKDIMNNLNMTNKAVQRALEKLHEKALISRSSFRRGAYNCDLRHLILCVLLTCSDLYAQYLQRKEA